MKNVNSLNINLAAIITRINKITVEKSISLSFDEVLQYLIGFFIGNNNLRIWETYDDCGNNSWHIYDPISGNYNCVNSEMEMQAWIENHHNSELSNNQCST